MDTSIDPHRLAKGIAEVIEATKALDQMYSLIGFTPDSGEAEMEGCVMLETLLLLREAGVDARLRQHQAVIVEEDGQRPTGDAFYTIAYGGLDIDAMGRTDLNEIAQSWFGHYYNGETYGGVGQEGGVTLPVNPAPSAMRGLLAPAVARMVAQVQAETLEAAAPQAGQQRVRPRI